MLKIFNTLAKRKEEFKPCKRGEVKMYTCGVTVYDDCHIGHARSLYIFDVIRRYLKHKGFKVKFVRNITDIDDKIINRSKELGISREQLTQKYINSYYEDMDRLSIDKADEEPRATENIAAMIKYINTLIDKGYAYVTGRGVYFRVRKFKNYGKLSGQSIDEMLKGVRVEIDEEKCDSLDFALWKKSQGDEPSWDSPWGRGRPGWHIECSVMSQKWLNTKTLDIHGGGRDLIFPHHENEIAQSEAEGGVPFALYWMHHGLLTIEGRKMAKSLGNFIRVKDILSRYPADVLKTFYLQAHYSSPLDFSWKNMQEKREALYRIIIFLNKVEKIQIKEKENSPRKKRGLRENEELQRKVKEAGDDFEKHMDDDFNTPLALGALFRLVERGNKILHSSSFSPQHLLALNQAKKTIIELGSILGLDFKEKPPSMPQEDIEALINRRESLRQERKFKEADKIREELERKGVIVEDTPEGPAWRIKL